MNKKESFLNDWLPKGILKGTKRYTNAMNALDQLILSILDKCATKIETETYTENREEDNLVEHIVNEIRKFIPKPLILLKAILTNKGDK